MNSNKSETNNGRDTQKGRFLPGNSGNGGRPRGSRNKVASDFVNALYEDFQKNGIEAINRTAKEQPHKYLQIISQILPKELDIALHVENYFLLNQEAKDFMTAYRLARDYIGAGLTTTPSTGALEHVEV